MSLFLSACLPRGLGYDSRTTKLILVNDFYVDKNSSLHIRYNKYGKPYTHQSSKLDFNNSSNWNHLNSVSYTKNTNRVIFKNNQVTMKNDDVIIFEKYLPTIDDIAINTNLNLSDKILLYTTFKDGINGSWDKKTYIAYVYNEDESKIYYFSIIDMDTHFKINLIDYSRAFRSNFLFYDDEINFIVKRDINNAFDYYYNAFDISTNQKASFCYRKTFNDITCFVKENNTIVSKSLFGELYPQEYQKAYLIALESDRGVSAMGSMIFDDMDNLHLFYNNLKDVTGNYFYNEMYEKNNPNTALHEQKIYWK